MATVKVRRASADDVENIYQFIREDDYSLNNLKLKYGISNISYLIDTSAISLVGTVKKRIIGFISISLSPYKKYLEDKDWNIELNDFFEIKDCNPFNTMFLSCCAFKKEFATDFLFYSLRQIFLTLPNLKYIGYLLPNNEVIDESLCNSIPPRSYNGSNYDKNANNKEEERNDKNSRNHTPSAIKQRFFFNKCRSIEVKGRISKMFSLYSLYVCFRKDLVYIMKIRKARVEDCDDLVPMFKEKNLLDNPDSIYYFSELLENKDENINTLVAEINNKIVGFMSMRSNLEYSALLENFDLDMFESLFNDISVVEIDEELLKDFSSTNISNISKKDSKSNLAESNSKDKSSEEANSSNNNSNNNINNINTNDKSKSNSNSNTKINSNSNTKINSNSKTKINSNSNVNVSSNNNIANNAEGVRTDRIGTIDNIKQSTNILNNGSEVKNSNSNSNSQNGLQSIGNINNENGSTDINGSIVPIGEMKSGSINGSNNNNDENDDNASNFSGSVESISDLKRIAYLNNVLCINLFYIDDFYSSYSNELLKAAFNLFPEKEYCLISLPTDELYIPLLENMVSVEYREDASVRHSLYICHRESALNTITVRSGVDSDIDKIEKLIESIPEYSVIMHQVKMSILAMNNQNDLKEKTILFVAECLDMVVGFAILKSYDNPEVLIEQFNIEKFCTKENHHFGKTDEFILSCIVMNPLYENKARYFLQEIMRLTDINCLIHTFNENMDFSTHKIISKEFVPVKRRRLIQFVDNKRDIHDVADHLDYNISLLTTNLLYEPKITINTRIVVIGASDTGISFLETLIYKSHFLFNNLVLISSNDEYGSKECPYAVDEMNYSVYDLSKMNIENYVQYINSVVKVINREEKNVIIETGEVIEYDYLIITTGLQFHPEILDKSFSELKGVFSGSKIEECIEYIDSLTNTTDQKFVVYGNDIQAFPILKALIDTVPADQIYFVVPNYDKNIRHWFDNRSLEKKLLKLIGSEGVKIYLDYQITNFETQALKLSDIVIKSTKEEDLTGHEINNIGGFFYVDKKSTDNDIFNAINNCYLVFDERLVIGSHFQTNDDYIFSAGPLTRYTSKYETLWDHSYFNSKECGKKLAKTLLPIFEKNEQALKNIKKENEALISFNDLVARKCILPYDLIYFHFDRPYLYNQTKAFRKTDENYGRDLIIHNDKDEQKKDKIIEYFHIHIDTYGFIQSVTYVGKSDLFSENMLCLYGMHEKYLNRLISRFDEGIIPDFKKFLNEPWAQPLFHDRFRSYMKRLREDLMNPVPPAVPLLPLSSSSEDTPDKPPMEMDEILIRLYEYVFNNEIVPEEERVKLYDSFDRSFDRKKIDYTVYRYLVESGFYNFP